MKARHVLIFGEVLLLLVTMELAQKGKPIHWTVTGSNHGLESDGGDSGGNMGICEGKVTFGQHTCNTFFTAGLHPEPTPECPAQRTAFTMSNDSRLETCRIQRSSVNPLDQIHMFHC